MKRLLPVILLLYATVASAKVYQTLWMSTFYNHSDNGHWMPQGGHWLQNGSAVSPDISTQILPQGTIVNFYCVMDAAAGADTITYTLYKNKVITSATCNFTGAASACAWTGRISISDGDVVNMKTDRTPGIFKAGHSCMSTLELVPQRDWPFTS